MAREVNPRRYAKALVGAALALMGIVCSREVAFDPQLEAYVVTLITGAVIYATRNAPQNP